jgi:hypothetical protein
MDHRVVFVFYSLLDSNVSQGVVSFPEQQLEK